jgi:uncharacterized membrane protein YadS
MPPVVPWFVAAFALLVAINSAGLIPAGRQRLLRTLLTWLLVISMSAIENEGAPQRLCHCGV